eukprot:1926514-Pleurochrysis_carterae.AAC.2
MMPLRAVPYERYGATLNQHRVRRKTCDGTLAMLKGGKRVSACSRRMNRKGFRGQFSRASRAIQRPEQTRQGKRERGVLLMSGNWRRKRQFAFERLSLYSLTDEKPRALHGSADRRAPFAHRPPCSHDCANQAEYLTACRALCPV